MTTYFLLLSQSEESGRRFVQLDDASVLAWFQRNWRRAANSDVLAAELEGPVHGLDGLFAKIREAEIPRPDDSAELAPLLEEHIHYEQDIEVGDHFVHVETDDDDERVEYFFFDDDFLDSDEALDRLPHPSRAGASAEEDDDDEEDGYAALIAGLS